MAAHGTSDEKLTRMANQIAAFFHACPAEEARAGIVRHIADFWTQTMRQTLQAAVDRGGEGLDPLVVQAFGGTQANRATGNAPKDADESPGS